MTVNVARALAIFLVSVGLDRAFSFVTWNMPMNGRPSLLGCNPENFETTAKNEAGPVCWNRRQVLATTVSAAVAPQLLQVSSVSAALSTDDGYMANPGPAYTQKVIDALARQADQAASAVKASNFEEYKKWGVTKVKNVVSRMWIDTLREGCELAQGEAGPYAEYLEKPTDAGIFFTDLELARRLPLFAAFSLYGPAAAVAGELMGSCTVRYLYDQLFIKEQGVSTETPWHQDGGYWRVKGRQVASVFVPLDPVEASNGLSFVRSSHTWPLHNPQHFADGTPYRGTSLPEMPPVSDLLGKGEISLQTFDLQPGDVLVFSAATVHGGPGNWGRALSTRWIGDDARFWDRPGEGAVPTIAVNLQDGQAMSGSPAAFPVSWHKKTAAA